MTTEIPLCTLGKGPEHPMIPIRDTNGWYCPQHDLTGLGDHLEFKREPND